MASRLSFSALDAEFPTSNFPALLYINNRPVLAFDASTSETCYFSGKDSAGLDRHHHSRCYVHDGIGYEYGAHG
jgi:hypothetical protein